MAKKPNILFIMGDDIGVSNVSCYSQGLMGYQTPNIDRIAKEGVMFTDFYGEQSCTAGRSAFCTGQSTLRTGLSKVGMPSADFGMLEEQVTIGWVMKEQGYRTAQFGKNHFGDLEKHFPTNHGFDEFYGVFYHLNAYEEPENRDYPPEDRFPDFREKYGPRNLTHCWADGRQEDKGPLDTERMKTVDDEFGETTKRFIKEAVDADEPFFVWHNTTHMHCYTHMREEDKGRSGLWQSEYHDVMIRHDEQIGELLDYLDELGIAEDTIVVYTTDNGAMVDTWPDSGMTPFRSEKDTNWEGAFRVPCVARYPGNWQEGKVLNGITSLLDWLPTLATHAGAPDVADKLKQGTKLGDRHFKQHLDGYDLNDYLSGKSEKSPRNEFIYITDDGDICGLRYDNWKLVFMEQITTGFDVWSAPFIRLRTPKIFNLRTDPYERADYTSNTYNDWWFRRIFMLVPAQNIVAEFLETFKEFPIQQRPPSFTIDHLLDQFLKLEATN